MYICALVMLRRPETGGANAEQKYSVWYGSAFLTEFLPNLHWSIHVFLYDKGKRRITIITLRCLSSKSDGIAWIIMDYVKDSRGVIQVSTSKVSNEFYNDTSKIMNGRKTQGIDAQLKCKNREKESWKMLCE